MLFRKEILVGKKLSRLKSMLPIAHVFEKLWNKNCLNSNYPTMLMSTKIDKLIWIPHVNVNKNSKVKMVKILGQTVKSINFFL